jgi:hypothetical protein
MKIYNSIEKALNFKFDYKYTEKGVVNFGFAINVASSEFVIDFDETFGLIEKLNNEMSSFSLPFGYSKLQVYSYSELKITGN